MGVWAGFYNIKFSPLHPVERYAFVMADTRTTRFAAYTGHEIEKFNIHVDPRDYSYSMVDGSVIDTATKYNTPMGWWDCVELTAAVSYVKARLNVYCSRVVELKDFFDYVSSGDVELDSSPGFPHVTKYYDKQEFFSDPDIVSMLRADDYKRDYLWTSFPKGEIIKKTKDRRQISGCEAAYLYHCLPLVHTFNKEISVKGVGLPLYLGTSFEGADWQTYVRNFSDCRYFIASDFSKYDSTVSSQLQWACFDIRKSFLDGSHHEKLWWLYDQMILKRIVEVDGVICSVQKGVPSGHPSTAHDNSLMSWIVSIVFLRRYYTIAEIEQKVVLAIYGDDLVFGFKEKPPFLPGDFKSFCAEHCMVAKVQPDFLTFTTCDFLSRQPSRYRGRYVPVLTRPAKYLAAMRWSEVSLTPQQEFCKLVDLRNKTAGSRYFDEADCAVEEYYKTVIVPNKLETDPMVVAACKRRWPEGYVLAVVGGVPWDPAAAVERVL